MLTACPRNHNSCQQFCSQPPSPPPSAPNLLQIIFLRAKIKALLAAAIGYVKNITKVHVCVGDKSRLLMRQCVSCVTYEPVLRHQGPFSVFKQKLE